MLVVTAVSNAQACRKIHGIHLVLQEAVFRDIQRVRYAHIAIETIGVIDVIV